MAHVIDGKSCAQALRDSLADEVRMLATPPGLAVVLVGNDAASTVYVRNKERAAGEAGMRSFLHRLPATIGQGELLALIAALNDDDAVDGILVQLPLPAHLDEKAVILAIDPAKDVDGFHPLNAGLLSIGQPALVPCTPLGCAMLLEHVHDDLSGLDAIILGRSNIVGKPMAQLLLARNCSVLIAHSRTRNLEAKVRAADIVVAAIGRPEFVRGNWIKPGATVIDVGINRVSDNAGKTRLVGDVAFEEAAAVAAHITPVPGGVGPMTIAVLLHNTLRAYRARRLP